MTAITDHIKASGDKHVLAALKTLESHTHVINISYYPRGKNGALNSIVLSSLTL